MSSALARPIRSSSKKLTSSKTDASFCLIGIQQWCATGRPGPMRSDFFDAARLPPRQVDAQLLRGAEDVLVGVTHLDGAAVAGEHLDVEAQRLHLLDQHLERLGDAGLGDVLALDDGLVDLHAA